MGFCTSSAIVLYVLESLIMRKILGIVVLGLLWCNVSFADQSDLNIEIKKAAQETEPRKEWRKVTLDAEDISKSIEGDPEKLQFMIDGIFFKPFYETYGRYSVYLDVTLK